MGPNIEGVGEMESASTAEIASLNEEARALWDEKACFWDERIGDGNDFQRLLIGPATERLLEVRPGQRILDIACGNGVVARRLAELGARVVAIDFSAAFLDAARTRATAHADQIEYLLVDATSQDQLLALGERRFDGAVCNMALMDIATIDPLLQALSRLLKPTGRFVFSVTHPCFNFAGGSKLALEEDEDAEGKLRQTHMVTVTNYLHLTPTRGAGMPGEPSAHYYFHRPLGVLFGSCFAAGFVLDGIEEPAFGPGSSSHRALSWANFRHIPPVLVGRLRLAGSQ